MGLNFINCFSFGNVNTSAKNANENEFTYSRVGKILSAGNFGGCVGPSGIPSDSERHFEECGLAPATTSSLASADEESEYSVITRHFRVVP